MSEERKEPEILSRQTNATTRRITVRLDKIVFDNERYCHRPSEALEKEENLQSLMDSLTLEGLQVPIEVFVDEHGRAVLLKGHRRTKSCQILAGKNVPGFTLDMEIDAIEVMDASPVDRLIRSISDNEVRLNLDRNSRIKVVKKLHDAGVPTDRAARSMGMSVRNFERDLLIAKHGWMYEFVAADSIAATHAYALLVAGVKAGRTKELHEDLDVWIGARKGIIREKEKLRKARDNKELSPAEKQVKRFMPNFLVEHWIELLGQKQRFDEDAEWNYSAGVELEKEQLHVSAVTLDLAKAPLSKLAKVASKLSLVAKQMIPFIQKAKEKENGDSSPDAAEAAYDLDFLRNLGLEDMANDLETQTRLEKEPDGEETPQQQPEARKEQDLTQQVKLPDPDAGSVMPPAVIGKEGNP